MLCARVVVMKLMIRHQRKKLGLQRRTQSHPSVKQIDLVDDHWMWLSFTVRPGAIDLFYCALGSMKSLSVLR